METFITAFTETQQRAHRINVDNGWWDERRAMRKWLVAVGFSEQSIDALFGIHLIGLIQTEPSESVEALRKPKLPLSSTEPHSVARELAGTIIRIMDMAEEMKIPVAEAIEAELECNAKRGRMHGGNVA